MEWIYRTMALFAVMIAGFGVHVIRAERRGRK
jgi:hypothetical protein